MSVRVYQVCDAGPDGFRGGQTFTSFQRACQAATVRASDLGRRPSNKASQVVVLDEHDTVVRAVPVLCRRVQPIGRVA